MIDKVCDKGFISKPCNSECECDKSCDVGEYLEYETCNCEKRLADKFVEEYNEIVEGAKIAWIILTEDKKMKFLRTVHFVIFNNLYNQHWSW